jgi:AcrR family transcriptional regulator
VARSALAFKPPRQRRSHESLERILDAAESLIRERGFDSMTIAEVVLRSGSSVGSIYARFSNKIGLLQAVQLRYHARVQNGLFAAFSGDHPRGESLQEAVARIVDVLSRLVLSDPELFRAFVVQAVFEPGVRAQGERVNAQRREKVVDTLLAHRDQIGHPDPDLAARWVYSMIMAALRERVTYGAAAELSGDFSDEAMIEQLTRTTTCFLTGRAGATAASDVLEQRFDFAVETGQAGGDVRHEI